LPLREPLEERALRTKDLFLEGVHALDELLHTSM